MKFGLNLFAGLALFLACTTASYAQEREWQLDATGEDAYLVFGVPSTADIGISLWCKIGSKKISLFAPAPHQPDLKHAKVTIRLHDKNFALHPKFKTEDTASTLEAQLPNLEVLWPELMTADKIEIVVRNHTAVYPVAGANFYEFKKLCETAPANVDY